MTQLQQLTQLVAQAHAALVPLASGYTQDGMEIKGKEDAMRQALALAVRVGDVASALDMVSVGAHTNRSHDAYQ